VQADALGKVLIAEKFEVTLDVIDNATIPNKDVVHILVVKKRKQRE